MPYMRLASLDLRQKLCSLSFSVTPLSYYSHNSMKPTCAPHEESIFIKSRMEGVNRAETENTCKFILQG